MYLFKRKHRGPLAAELAKATGGVVAMAGSLMFCRVMLYPADQPQSPVSYADVVVVGGDLWGDPANPAMWMWLGIAAMVIGVLGRLVGFLYIEKGRTE
jgi:hypothetical protein